MSARERVRSGLVTLALVGLAMACQGEAERTFYNDFDATDGTTPTDGTQGSGDAVEEGGVPGDGTVDGMTDSSGDAGAGTDADAAQQAATDAATDGGLGDGAADSLPEAAVDCGPVDTANNCGACGTACDTTRSREAGCNSGACTYSGCNPGYGDCDAGAPNTNGCETPLDTPVNCAGCGITCDTTHSRDAGCNGTACTYGGCNPGYGDCDAAPPNSNGCETPTDTTTNCTGCGITCDTAHSRNPGCNGAACTYGGCNPGYQDCDAGAPNSDGCETPTTTAANCGGCGVACGSQHTTDAGCTGTACTYACSAGWSNCDTVAPNTAGCECNTPSCCGDAGVGSCQTTHSNGNNQAFYDCLPLLTATTPYATAQELAFEACASYTGSQSLCTQYQCTPTSMGPIICSLTNNSCFCWAFAGSNIGYVDNGDGNPADCYCPSTNPAIGDRKWN